MHDREKFIRNCRIASRATRLIEQIGFNPFKDFKFGLRVARGYADIGFEEFYSLGSGRLLSLVSGKVVELTESEHRHYVVLLDNDALADMLVRVGVISIESRYERGAWMVRCVNHEGEPFETSESTLELALIAPLSFWFGEGMVTERPRNIHAN